MFNILVPLDLEISGHKNLHTGLPTGNRQKCAEKTSGPAGAVSSEDMGWPYKEKAGGWGRRCPFPTLLLDFNLPELSIGQMPLDT